MSDCSGPASRWSVLIGRFLQYDTVGVLLAPDVTYAQNVEYCSHVG